MFEKKKADLRALSKLIGAPRRGNGEKEIVIKLLQGGPFILAQGVFDRKCMKFKPILEQVLTLAKIVYHQIDPHELLSFTKDAEGLV
jgi:hypothetical protein